MMRGRPDAWYLTVIPNSKQWGLHLIKLCVDGLVVPQDPAQSKQWGFKVFVMCQLLVLNCNHKEVVKSWTTLVVHSRDVEGAHHEENPP